MKLERTILCLPLLFTLTLVTQACDAGDEPVEDRSAEVAAADEPCDEKAEHGKFGKPGKRGQHMAERLCDEIACSDEQREQIAALVVETKGDRGPDHAEREARHQALADAFRSDTFDLAALPQPSDEHHEARRTEMATMIVGVHGLLTPEQRETIASTLETEGPMALLGRGKHGGKHGFGPGDRDGEFDPAKHAEHKVERLCETVTCSEAQVEQFGAIFTDALAELPPREPPAIDEGVTSKFAAAFRAETLAIADVEALLDAARPPKPRAEMGELLVAVHAVLTPEQRALLADKIEEQGPHAVMGGKGHRGKKGKHGKKGKGKKGKPEFDSSEPV